MYDIFSNYRITNTQNIFKYIDKYLKLDITFYNEGFIYRYTTDLVKNDNFVNNNLVFFLIKNYIKENIKKLILQNYLIIISMKKFY